MSEKWHNEDKIPILIVNTLSGFDFPKEPSEGCAGIN